MFPSAFTVSFDDCQEQFQDRQMNRQLQYIAMEIPSFFIEAQPSEESSDRNPASMKDAYLTASNKYYELSILVQIQENGGVRQEQPKKPSFQANFKILLKGYLDKKTLNSSWQSRYFCLTPTRLIYYTSQAMLELKGCFNLISLIEQKLSLKYVYPQISLYVEIQKDQLSQLKQQRPLIHLRICQKDQYKAWLDSIERVVGKLNSMAAHRPQMLYEYPFIDNKTLVQNNQKLANGINSNFWNNITISLNELKMYANHLDIILFRSKDPIYYFHRFFMRSYYDHVALLIRNQFEQIYIFQAVESRGVCITPLKTFLENMGEVYEQISYRKLMTRNQEALKLDHLQDYLNSLLGKKYELSLSKLFIGNQSDQDFLDNKQNQQPIPQMFTKPEKTYFCSQLLADVYLKFGIVTEGKSNKYWPKDFEENNLNLSSNYYLTPLMKVERKEGQNKIQLVEE